MGSSGTSIPMHNSSTTCGDNCDNNTRDYRHNNTRDYRHNYTRDYRHNYTSNYRHNYTRDYRRNYTSNYCHNSDNHTIRATTDSGPHYSTHARKPLRTSGASTCASSSANSFKPL